MPNQGLAPLVEPLESRRLLAGTASEELLGGDLLTQNIGATPQAVQTRPSVIASRPAPGLTDVSRDTFIAADVYLPGPGINPATVTTSTIRLLRTSDAQQVAAVVNTSGGGDALVLTPSAPLQANTQYTFEVTSGVKDLNGNGFIPYSVRFTTGTSGGTSSSDIRFEKVSLPTAQGRTFSGVTIGPDHKFYATTLEGQILRFSIAADGTLGSPQVITTVRDRNGGDRLITGIVFDPRSTATNLLAWVTHSQATLTDGDDWTGKISRVAGADLQRYVDVVVGLPRSLRDHLTNQATFGPNGKLYVAQGSNTAMGAADEAWGNRPERALSGAILVVDAINLETSVLATGLPLNVQTEAGGTYNPASAGASVVVWASGMRNAYDMVWHSNGHLYVPANGSAAGGDTPASPDSTVPGLTDFAETQPDFLFDVYRGRYYGHPNPRRQEYVLNGGNPTSGHDPQQVSAYPVGVLPDADWRGPSYTFGRNYSPNGIIEYRGGAFGGALRGRLLVTQYSGGDNIIALTVGADGRITGANTSIAGFSGFVDPLDIVEDRATGNLYVAELGAERLTLLRPQLAVTVPNLRASTSKLFTSDIRGGASGVEQILVISNIGDGPLQITDLAFEGAGAGSFVVNNVLTLPYSIAPGQVLRLKVAMKAPADAVPGITSAVLNITSNDPDRPVGKVLVRGLVSASSGGEGEPSLQRIMDLFQLGVVVGDSNSATTNLDIPPTSTSQELRVQRLVKAGAGPVVIETLAAYGLGSSPAVSLGYYEPGTPGTGAELFQVSPAHSQTVRPTGNGSTSFDPGTSPFGLVAMFPGFANSNGSARRVYSEDVLNQWEADVTRRRKIRFYRMPRSDGSFIPNAYVFAIEEANFSSVDNQDFVGIIRNVTAISSGPELGLENLDGAPFADRLVFNRIRTLDPDIPNTVHRSATIRVRNTGNQDLVIDDLIIGGPWTLRSSFPGSLTVRPGGFTDITVRLEASSGDIHLGSLRIVSNDADEPSRVIELAGFWQSQSENQQEPSLFELGRMFGYTTVFQYEGQKLSNGGLREAVGDEVLARYFVRANADEPVTVQQITAFHTQGNAVPVAWFRKGSTSSRTTIFTHLGTDSQSVVPRLSDGSGRAIGRFKPTGAFGFIVDKAYSDSRLNPQEVADNNHGHAVRFFPLKDRSGVYVPNTYIMVMDYFGVNYDYNDNVYVVQNIRPEELPATPVGLTAIATTGGVQLNWGDNTDAGLVGYHVYRSTSATSGFQRITSQPLTVSQLLDATMTGATKVYYRVAAVTATATSMFASTATA